MATVVTMHEAKTHLSKLVARAAAGEEIVIARGKEPRARLVAVEPATKPKRQAGRWKGRFKIDDRFFEPLPEDELSRWEGRES